LKGEMKGEKEWLFLFAPQAYLKIKLYVPFFFPLIS